ncbi:MAG: SPOR domain-containing protein [Pseudomonadota bacterium]
MMPLRSRTLISVIILSAFLVILVSLFKRAHTEWKPLTVPNKPLFPSDQFSLELGSSNHPIKNAFKLPLAPTHAWVLQVADFKENSDANSLLQSLQKNGFKAYSRQVRVMAGPITRVFVGPEIKSEQIKLLETRLNKEMQLKSTVTAFDPLLL